MSCNFNHAFINLPVPGGSRGFSDTRTRLLERLGISDPLSPLVKPFQLTPRSPKCCRTVDQSVGSCLPKRSVIIIKYCTTVTLFCALEKKNLSDDPRVYQHVLAYTSLGQKSIQSTLNKDVKSPAFSQL